jgi:hypothetical protein
MSKFQKVIGLILFAGLLGMATPARADILLEPYLKYDVTGSDNINGTNSTLTGPGFGARVGYQALLFFFALDYGITNGTVTTNGSSNSFTQNQAFVEVGVHVPLLRAWAGYGFLDSSTTNTNPNITISGSALKIGLGFTGLPLVSINLEYTMDTYTQEKYNSTTTSLSSSNGNTVALGVSIPFSF